MKRVSQHAMYVQRTKSKAQLMLLDLFESGDLTHIEILQMLIDLQAGVLKDMLRAERHPEDPDKEADIE